MMQGAHIFVHGRLRGVGSRLDGLVARAGAKLHRRPSARVTHTVVAHAAAPDFERRKVMGTAISEISFRRALGLAPRATGIGRMFSREEVARLLGLDGEMIDRLVLFDILDPAEERYCFRDVASAREVARLLTEGMGADDVVAAGARLRDRGMRLSEARLQGASWGELMLLLDARLATLDGQFALELGDVAPDLGELHALAQEHEEEGESHEAERIYRLLTRLDRSRPDYPLDLGNLLLEQARYDEAILAFIDAFHRDPKDADAVYNIRRARHEQGADEAAIAHYREALRIKQNHSFARYNLALLLTDAERHEEALPLWTAIAEEAEGTDRMTARKAALLCRIALRTSGLGRELGGDADLAFNQEVSSAPSTFPWLKVQV